MPVPNDGAGDDSEPYTFDYSNMLRLVSFSAVPDEQAYCKIKLVSSAGGMDKVKIKHKMLTKKMFDIKNLRDDVGNKADLAIAGTLPGFPPSNQWSWLVGFLPATQIANSASTLVPVLTVQVKVAYHCELLDRRELDFTTQE